MPIELQHVTYDYMPGTPSQVRALDDVCMTIQDGEFLGLIGPTGSGKSTLIQHLNGLLVPTSGRVLVDGLDTRAKGADLRRLRQKVGLVFQYPEDQVFEETVYEDIAFGPKNLGVPAEEIEERVREAMALVGLPDSLMKRSPFELSGGQLRRVALAGVLAMRPEVLVLDEPTAGLDPLGKREILGHIRRLHERGLTVVMVSHNMEEVARLADRLVVLDHGRIVLSGTPREVFAQGELLESIGLDIPDVTKMMRELRKRGWPVRTDVLTLEEAYEEISRYLAGTKAGGVR
ncbi:MAG: energy-coupling factor transporter ATPase [Firmicutes bacterium]|nr:energy-coupling factor transporter ATPase [Candidatus Fermentithermobacillaceae bacterium]